MLHNARAIKVVLLGMSQSVLIRHIGHVLQYLSTLIK